MTRTTTARPTDAEMIQTACRRLGPALLAVEGAETTPIDVVHLFESQAFLLVPTHGEAMAAVDDAEGTPAMLEVTDWAPIDLRERVRSVIWLNGTLFPVPRDLERDLAIEIAGEHPDDGLLDIGHGASMLRLQVETAVIASGAGAASVPAAELADATPDPFWECEAGWLAHLDADHADLVGQLARRLPDDLRRGRVRPLGLDRFGIRFRIEGPAGDSDVRLPFPRPVSDVVELSRALRNLAGCPFLNSMPD
ncbi:hypothetical protein GP2_043_00330 [Gordonia paraffinivorans NBRC 108238]|uniref:DUF2470 domain-containing protein n=1 Tax=Gordonia paraffinivorans NBRC 108238 TaxID=1223543 RepID=A0ABQ0IQV9_9ACTN|nr:DUF2470 domain-containing protein [Gordonia paraffinivorans]GAC85848.1 hypothetical protein GP2_043_00330 [Gordonia paraffinivorans NBRC 108238]